MKKIIILITLILLVGTFHLFSATPINPGVDKTFSAMNTPFTPTSTRMLGMGNAGLAIVSGSDSMYYNPAGLASRRAVVLIGNPTVTLYHPLQVIESGILDTIEDSDSIKYSDLVDSVIEILGSGYSKLADIDAAVGFTAGGFGFMTNAKASLHTFNVTSNGGIYAEINTSALIGYGHRFNISSNFSIDFGITAGFNYFGFTDDLNVATVMNALDGEDGISSLLSNLPVMAGFRIPLNVGINVNIPFGFKYAIVGRNLIPNTWMYAMNSYDDVLGNLFGGDGIEEFTYKTKFSLDMGLAWEWKNSIFSPSIAIDFKDMIGFFQDEMNLRNMLYHTNIGAEIRLLSFLDVRGGLNQGYWTVGAGLDLWAIKMDIAYFWQEFGVTAGANPCDGLSIRFNIGWDR